MSESSPQHRGSTLTGPLGWIDSLISRAEAIILALGILLMAGNTIANVIGRFVFGYSLFFSEELNRALIVLITFAGIGYAARHGRHIRMSAIFDALTVSLRKVLMVLIALITALCMFALCYFSIKYIGKLQTSGRVLPALQIPVYLIYLWVPVGFAVTGIQYFLTAIKNLTSSNVYLSTTTLDGYESTEVEI